MDTNPDLIGEIFVQNEAISPANLVAALNEQKTTQERLGEILSRRELIDQWDLYKALSQQLGHSCFDPAKDETTPAALDLIPLDNARRYRILPIRLEKEVFVVAMVDPLDIEVRDYLNRVAKRIDRNIEVLLGSEDDLEQVRESAYGIVRGNSHVAKLIDQVVEEMVSNSPIDEEDEAEAQRRAQEAGIISLVDEIITQALQERATDIHIEPLVNGLLIRNRVDGVLYDSLTTPQEVKAGVISRIKILADMDIAERRTTQDGRFTHRKSVQDVDIRVSSIPTIHGEKLALRLLDKSNFNFSLRELGFSDEDFQAFVEAIREPYGLILLSGPTGSGKTTTLYSSLKELRGENTNITTVEDPVEYQIDRINQVQVNRRKNVTFSNALRSFLRQDPDVIMVGEIRDQDTAEIAVRAALTGHLVFSTIHANSAPATAMRLASMGIEPFMAASSLTMVAAQRLVRRNCPHCLEEYKLRPEVLLALKIDGNKKANQRFLRGAGCAACSGRGFLGRVALVERMTITAEIRQAIANKKTATDIRDLAVSQGMFTLRDSGLLKAAQGIVALEEVLRVCSRDA